MLRNTLAAALRNLGRNRFYGALSILGLALGLSAAILAMLYIVSELRFDRFVPGHERVFVVTSDLRSPSQAPVVSDYAPAWLAHRVREGVPQASATARLVYDQVSLRRGQTEAREDLAWVDPAFFEILPAPAIAGDPRRALQDPNGLVITRTIARKYFGRDAPLGETMELNGRQILRVTAVLADFPSETHLRQQVFASGRASFSPLARLDAAPSASQGFATWLITERPGQSPPARFESIRLRTYVQLADPTLAPAAAQAMARLTSGAEIRRGLDPGSSVNLSLVPLSALHLQDFKGANLGAGDLRSSRGALLGLAVAAALVLALAIINLVNLTTARAGQRAVEIGVRKAAGAHRNDLVLQFVGEASLLVVAALVIALAIVELALPSLNAFLGKSMSFAYWRDPGLLIGLGGAALALSILAGAYPGFVLAGFRPADVLKGGPVEARGSGQIRQALVVGQLAVLVVLMVAVAVVWMQTRYATSHGLLMNTDQVLVVQATPCRGAFEAEVRRLPGVRTAACSSRNLLGLDNFDAVKTVMEAKTPGGPTAGADMGLVDYDWFAIYGVRPLAGRLFSRDHGQDELAPQNFPEPQHGPVVINMAAARSLGFPSAQAALDKLISVGPGYGEFNVIGVVPDLTLDLKSAQVKATFFLVDFANYPADQVLSVRLDGARAPETLRAIDRLWRQSGQAGAIHRQFLDEYVERLYIATIRQGVLVTALCALALLLACLGLLGLAAFNAERRTKEIGVRKALGASRSAIVRMLVWQFTQPVLIACLIAWPLAWLIMRHWLNGFAYQVGLSPWVFVAAGVTALLIAWATVLTHAFKVANRRPVDALRHE